MQLYQNIYLTCCLTLANCSDDFCIYIESDYPNELEVDDDFIATCKIHLSKHKTLALLGNLGSGRRTLANQIALRLRKNNSQLKIVGFNAFRFKPTDPETMLSTIIIVPDLIKNCFTDEHTNNTIKFLQKLHSDAEENNCFIIATFQNNIWNDSKFQSKNQSMYKNILSLFLKPFPVITEIERLRQIARNSECDISDEVLKRICEKETIVGRSLKLALVMNYQAFKNDGFFTDPLLKIINELKTLAKSDNMIKQVKFQALVLTMLHGGEIAKAKLEEALDSAFLDDPMETEDRKEIIQGCIQKLIKVYIKESADRKTYKMIHDVITKCTFLAAAETHFNLLFTECYHFPLLECIRYKRTSERLKSYGNIVIDHENLEVGMPTEYYPMIAKIFVQRNELIDMVHIVRFFKNEEFQVEWLKQNRTAK